MYSVPCEYVGLAVQIKSYAWQIAILYEGKVIGEHDRCFNRYQKIYNPWHYISALENGTPFKQLMNLLPEVFSKIRNKLESCKEGDKQFISILPFVNKYELDKETNACNLALIIGDSSAKLVEQYLQPAMQEEINEYKFIQLQNPPDADCSSYSKIHLTTHSVVERNKRVDIVIR